MQYDSAIISTVLIILSSFLFLLMLVFVIVRKTKCPAYSKKFLKCERTGYFLNCCRKSSDIEHGALQDQGSATDSGELDGITRPRHSVRDLRRLSHHAADQFGNWEERRAEPQPAVTVSEAVPHLGENFPEVDAAGGEIGGVS